MSASEPPTIILSGSSDRLVPVRMLHAFQAAMRKAGACCEIRVYDGQGHGFCRKFESEGKYFTLTLAEIDSFFQSLGWL